MKQTDKPLVWLYGEIKSPPFSSEARIESGYLLRQLQSGMKLSLPHSRPMPATGPRCHELRIIDENKQWRIVYRIDTDAILILDIFEKKTRQMPLGVIASCKRRIQMYDAN